MSRPQEPRIRTEPTVVEGGTIVIHVGAGVDQVYVFVPGAPKVAVPVVAGRAEFRVPPNVRGGTDILITDMQYPNPAGQTVGVVGGQGS